MQALQLSVTPARASLAARLPRAAVRAAILSPASPLRLTSRPDPEAPAAGWRRLRPILSGICGTDLAALTGRLSPALAAVASLPAVPGHEILARDGDGRRVVVDPLLSCVPRGLTPCAACAAGRPGQCENFARGNLAPAMFLGFCRDVPGGWAETTLAHDSQIHPVPDAVADRSAALAEPLAVAFHALRQARPAPADDVYIVGAGTIGLCLLAALRLSGHTRGITLQARHPLQADLARRLGADRTGAEPGDRFAVVYECGGTGTAVARALRCARPGGTVALVGTAGVAQVDWTDVWSAERRLVGCVGYGPTPGGGHDIDDALEALADSPRYPLGDLVTAVRPLARWRQALREAFDHGANVKVAFVPRP